MLRYADMADARLVLTDALIRDSLKAEKAAAEADEGLSAGRRGARRRRFAAGPAASPAQKKAKPVVPAGIQTSRRPRP